MSAAAAAGQSFEDRVQAARSGLIDATRRAGLERDRYAEIIAAQDAVIGLFPEFLAEMERLRQPVHDHDLQAAVTAGVRECTADIIRHNTLRTALIGAGVALAWTVAAIGGTWWWCQSHLSADVAGIEHTMTGPDAKGWRLLVENNDLPAAVAAAEKAGTCGPQDGREACTLPLWAGPPPPPPLTPAQH